MSNLLQFGPFVLDPANALLKRGTQPLELAPKAFAVLCHLAGRPGQLVTKEELLDAVWGRRFVSESVLKTAINAIRAVLQDDSRRPIYIETVARRGYRFIGAPTAAAPAAPAGAAPAVGGDTSELIGRAAASARLAEYFAAAQAGQRQLVLVAGDAGIGKTTLIERFIATAAAGGACVAVGQCIEQFGSGEPYLPVLDALAALCRGDGGAAWTEALHRVAPTWLAQLPWLVAASDQPQLQRELAGAAQERMLREFGALLDAQTRDRTLVLAIEDLHWSDHATVNLIGYLARRRAPARWLLLASYRPTDVVLNEHPLQGLRQELRLHRMAHEIVLEAFSERDVDAYLQHRFEGQPIGQRAALARALHAHTEGLPLFVANVVDEMLTTGALARDTEGRWTPAPTALQALQVPETIAGIIEKQIARLPGELRSLLEAASVIGAEFSHLTLAQALAQNDAAAVDALQARCDGLARRGEWLHSAAMTTLPDGRLLFRYAFRHALYQRVFYERTEPAQRLQLHLRIAQALQDAYGDHVDRVAAEIAVHFERARDTAAQAGVQLAAAAAQAIDWRIRAARAAVALYAPDDALGHYARALAAGPNAADAARCYAARAELLQQSGDGPQALAASAAALEAARAAADPALSREIALVRAHVCAGTDRSHEAIELIDGLLAAELPRAQQVAALIVKADALGNLGRLQESDAASRAALDACADDALLQKAEILAGMAMTHYRRGTVNAGLAIAEEARALYEQANDERGLATTTIRVGVFAMLLGQTERAEAALNDARRRAHGLRDIESERGALLNLIKLYSDRADTERALVLLDEGWHLAPSFESPIAEGAYLHGYYYCHYLRGDLAAALHDAERVRAFAEQLNSVYWRAGTAALICDLYIYLDDLAQAEALVDAALALIGSDDSQHQRPRLIAKRAWLDVLQGQPVRALERLAALDASGQVEQPEDRTAVARVRAQAQLAVDDAAGAATTLAAFDGAPTAETWALMLALRLRAQTQLQAIDATDLARAEQELAGRSLPALESLVLLCDLAAALAAAGRTEEAQARRARAQALRERLTQSLAAVPERQRAFVANRRFAATLR